jgi:hypothetical protein
MASPFSSLAWKEWNDRKWSLALGSAWITLGVAYAFWYEALHRVHAPVASFEGTCLMYGLCTAIFLAMRTALSESTQGTLGFSASLPASLQGQAWVRVGGAIASIAAPIILGALILSVVMLSGSIEQAPARISNYDKGFSLPERPPLSGLEACGLLWKVVGITIASSVELLLLLSIIGARRRAESHIGFLGACMAFGWLILAMAGASKPEVRNWLGAILPQCLVINYSYGDLNGSYFGDLSFARSVWPALAVNLLVLATLATWFTFRYGTRRPTLIAKHSWSLHLAMPAVLSRLPISWPGRVVALIWLDLRQAMPMCLAGLGLAVLFTVFTLLLEPRTGSGSSLAGAAAGLLGASTWYVAILWGAVIGSGIFAGELGPKLGQFWRSRPISTSAWYWVKFVSGLVAVLSVLDLVAILVSWNSPHVEQGGRDEMSRSYIACMPLLHALTYAIAVVGVCWLRRPVLAAFLSLFIFFLLPFAFDAIPGAANFEPMHVYNELFSDEIPSPYQVLAGEGGPKQPIFDLARHGYPVVYGGIAAMIVIASVVGWFGALRSSGLGRNEGA